VKNAFFFKDNKEIVDSKLRPGGPVHNSQLVLTSFCCSAKFGSNRGCYASIAAQEYIHCVHEKTAPLDNVR